MADDPLPVSKPRTRRDVSQLFEALERKGPEQAKLVTTSIGIKLVLVPAGSFRMGSPIEEVGRKPGEGPTHDVTVSKAFYVGVVPVTQEQYKKVMGTNPARFSRDNGGGPEHPVESVSWDDAIKFCRKLSEVPEERQAGRVYRLLSEAEWEFACRAGTSDPFALGTTLSGEKANFDAGYPYGAAERHATTSGTTPVGQFPANRFGLHDVHGNVWEWCADWFHPTYYAKSPKRDPAGPESGKFRVLRGGCWRSHGITCRSAYRNAMAPHHADIFTGFRIAVSAT